MGNTNSYSEGLLYRPSEHDCDCDISGNIWDKMANRCPKHNFRKETDLYMKISSITKYV